MARRRHASGVGMVGYAFMGAAHSQALAHRGRVFDLPLRARPGRDLRPGRRPRAAAAARLGWAATETDWRALVDRDDIDLVDICTPGDTHAEIAIAALEAGKHVLCEKPLANTVAEAEAMAAAAAGARRAASGRWSASPTAGCPRSRWPASWSQQGRLGEIRHVRAQYLQDWIVDPEAPLVWRLQKEKAGSGALGDIGAHIVDLTQFITGEPITGVSGADRDVRRRSGRCPAASARPGAAAGTGHGAVTVDDAALFLGPASRRRARRPSRRPGSPPAARTRSGIEINGSRGSLAFDFEDMNVLHVLRRAPRPGRRRRASAGSWSPSRRTRTSRLVAAGPHPRLRARASPTRSSTWSTAIAAGRDPTPSFADGLQVQRVLRARVDGRSVARQNRGCTPRTAAPSDRRDLRRTRR